MSMWVLWSIQVVENSGSVCSTLLRVFSFQNYSIKLSHVGRSKMECTTQTTHTIRLIIQLTIMNAFFQPPNKIQVNFDINGNLNRNCRSIEIFHIQGYSGLWLLIYRPQHWTHWVFTNITINGLACMTVHRCCFFIISPLLLSHTNCLNADISVCEMAIMLLIALKTSGLNGWMWQHERSIIASDRKII